jgi:hypothetical protein
VQPVREVQAVPAIASAWKQRHLVAGAAPAQRAQLGLTQQRGPPSK